jgi:hypothetical protein
MHPDSKVAATYIAARPDARAENCKAKVADLPGADTAKTSRETRKKSGEIKGRYLGDIRGDSEG